MAVGATAIGSAMIPAILRWRRLNKASLLFRSIIGGDSAEASTMYGLLYGEVALFELDGLVVVLVVVVVVVVG